MRDLTRYPITQDEIVGCLHKLIDDINPATTGLVGDMRPLLLEAAIEAVREVHSDEHMERCIAADLWFSREKGDERPFSPRESCIRWNECLRYKQCLGQEICP